MNALGLSEIYLNGKGTLTSLRYWRICCCRVSLLIRSISMSGTTLSCSSDWGEWEKRHKQSSTYLIDSGRLRDHLVLNDDASRLRDEVQETIRMVFWRLTTTVECHCTMCTTKTGTVWTCAWLQAQVTVAFIRVSRVEEFARLVITHLVSDVFL